MELVSRRTLLAGASAVLLGAQSTLTRPPRPVSEFGAGVVTGWFDLLLELVRRTPGYSPPVAARAVGYAGVALYEAVVPGMAGYRSLAGSLNGFAELPVTGRRAAFHWPTVAAAALAEVYRGLFATAPADLRAGMTAVETASGAGVPRGIRDRAADRGRAVAAAVLEWARGDGGHEGYLRNFPADYAPPAGPGLWTPTPPGFQPALQPSWGTNRCLALAGGDVCAPGPPPPYSAEPGSEFFAEAVQVYEAVNALTDEQHAIAQFWSDDPGVTATPPGHSISILTQLLHQQDASLEHAAHAYARVGIAVADAFIACWHTKYRHNLLRPISYIHAHIDPTWGPLPLATPPFPEYTSGHSVQSAATATVLTDLFGPTSFIDDTHAARGLPARSYTSFTELADEAAISRLYGGIHFHSAIQTGLHQGQCIGHTINALPWRR